MGKTITLLLILSLIFLPITTAPGTDYTSPESIVESIKLTVNENTISWETNGHSTSGFKVIWSKTENPTYPTRTGDKYHYYSSPDKNTDILTSFDGEGTYYARVCEYLGGKCGKYSNQVELKLSSEEIISYKETVEKKIENKSEEQKEELINDEHQNNCNGCLHQELCYPLGHRIAGTFCANTLNLTTQFDESSACENNFECKSNVCISGECVSAGLITKVINWFKRFF